MRVPPSNSRGLSALGISGENEEKQQHFCHCSSPFYSAACVGSLLSVALFGCIFSMVRILAIIAFTRFDFQNHNICCICNPAWDSTIVNTGNYSLGADLNSLTVWLDTAQNRSGSYGQSIRKLKKLYYYKRPPSAVRSIWRSFGNWRVSEISP